MGGVFSNELRGKLLKKADFSLECAHDYCPTYQEAFELQNFEFSQANEPHKYVNVQSGQQKGPKKPCKLCVYQQL